MPGEIVRRKIYIYIKILIYVYIIYIYSKVRKFAFRDNNILC